MSILAVTKHVNEDKVYHLDDSGDNILVNNTDNNNSIKKKSENI